MASGLVAAPWGTQGGRRGGGGADPQGPWEPLGPGQLQRRPQALSIFSSSGRWEPNGCAAGIFALVQELGHLGKLPLAARPLYGRRILAAAPTVFKPVQVRVAA